MALTWESISTWSARDGTNDLHGSVYDYVENTIFNAKPFLATPASTKPPLHYNQYGFALGARLRFPGCTMGAIGRSSLVHGKSWIRLVQAPALVRCSRLRWKRATFPRSGDITPPATPAWPIMASPSVSRIHHRKLLPRQPDSGKRTGNGERPDCAETGGILGCA